MVLLASERTYDYLYWLPLLKLSREPFRKNYEKLEINKPAATEKVQHPVPVNAMRLSLGKVVINFVSA